MSLFNFLKKKKGAPESKKKEEVAGAVPVPAPAVRKLSVVAEREKDLSRAAVRGIRSDVLIRPRVTEKASAGAARGVYVFEVSARARKSEIATAVQALYGVSPVKIATAPIPRKRITLKGIPGRTSGGKKAYVYLKKGEKMEVV